MVNFRLMLLGSSRRVQERHQAPHWAGCVTAVDAGEWNEVCSMNKDVGRDSLVGGCVCVFPQAAWSPESCEGEGVKNESLMRILTLEVAGSHWKGWAAVWAVSGSSACRVERTRGRQGWSLEAGWKVTTVVHWGWWTKEIFRTEASMSWWLNQVRRNRKCTVSPCSRAQQVGCLSDPEGKYED